MIATLRGDRVFLAFGLVAGAVANRLDRRRLMWRCELASAALAAGYALATNVLAAMACYLGLNAAGEMAILTGIIYRQRVTPGHLQGRVNVIARMIAWGGQPFGAVAGGIIARAISARAALLAAGLGVVVSLLLCLLGPLHVPRARETQPVHEQWKISRPGDMRIACGRYSCEQLATTRGGVRTL